MKSTSPSDKIKHIWRSVSCLDSGKSSTWLVWINLVFIWPARAKLWYQFWTAKLVVVVFQPFILGVNHFVPRPCVEMIGNGVLFITTVHRKKTAPVDMVNIPLFTGFHRCQVVNAGFLNHQQYVSSPEGSMGSMRKTGEFEEIFFLLKDGLIHSVVLHLHPFFQLHDFGENPISTFLVNSESARRSCLVEFAYQIRKDAGWRRFGVLGTLSKIIFYISD